jgi:hypothetical protein
MPERIYNGDRGGMDWPWDHEWFYGERVAFWGHQEASGSRGAVHVIDAMVRRQIDVQDRTELLTLYRTKCGLEGDGRAFFPAEPAGQRCECRRCYPPS